MLTTQSAPPDTSIYNQSIPASGYGYLTTRDGTKLAIDVHPPQDVTHVLPGVELPPIPSGPTPTLIEYSGYGYANPAGPENGIAILANLMGFTVVDVNMRGTGCSGGAFDFFEPLQNLDGYDVVETIAHQPWVLNHKVGMMGISYGGISQLFTAATQPPDLAAISPLSVIDNTQTTLYPGGILNTGFALEWAKERVHDAEAAGPDHGPGMGLQTHPGRRPDLHRKPGPAPRSGRPAARRSKKTATTSPKSPTRSPRHLRPQDQRADLHGLPVDRRADRRPLPDPGRAHDRARERSGSPSPTAPTSTRSTRRPSTAGSTSSSSTSPSRPPILASAAVHAAAPLIYQEAMGIPGVTLPPDPIQLQPTYVTALSAFENLKQIRVLFDSGAGGLSPGQPYPGFEKSFSEFPIPGTEATAWYLSPGGSLSGTPPAGIQRRRIHLGRQRPAEDRLQRRHRLR